MSDLAQGLPTLSQLILTWPSRGHCRPSAEEMKALWSKTHSRSHGEGGAKSGSQNFTFNHYTNIWLYRV